MHIISPELKAKALQRFFKGIEEVAAIALSVGVSRQTIYNWADGKPRESKPASIHIKTSNKELWKAKNRCAFQDRVNNILQVAGVTPLDGLDKKLTAMIDLYNEDPIACPARSLCYALKVSRGAFYGRLRFNKNENAWFYKHRAELEVAIENIFNEFEQRYGSSKITAVLKERGFHTCRETVMSIMRQKGLRCIRNEAKRFWKKNIRKPQNLVKRNFKPERPNQIWVSDVTEWNFHQVKYYICAIIDLYSRKVIAYKIGLRNSTHLVMNTFKAAWKSRNASDGLIYHSDRGSNYKSIAMSKMLYGLGVKESFSRAHTPSDNSVNESFFNNFKSEELYRRRYKSLREFKKAIENYVEFYNNDRIHSFNNNKTPLFMENKYFDTTGVCIARTFPR